MSDRSMKPIVTIVAPILMRYDAISYAARDMFKMLSESKHWDVKIVSGCNEFSDIGAQIVGGPGDLLLNESIILGFTIHFLMSCRLVTAARSRYFVFTI
jgi:hypothetical protein